ncbi:MAG: hypothetical protein AAF649_08615 [Verrucomicrobiota bacterium]
MARKKDSAYLQRALMLARKRYLKKPGVVSVGIGFKHSVKNGYSGKAKCCIKFLVDKKRNVKSKKSKLPRTVQFTEKGKRHRFPTDVIELGVVSQQSGAYEYLPYVGKSQKVQGGTPGYLVFNRADPDDIYLVTAGHIFKGVTNRIPVFLNKAEIGALDTQTLNIRTNHALLDLAVVKISNKDFTLENLASMPWTSLSETVPETEMETLEYWELYGQPKHFIIAGRKNYVRAEMDSYFDKGNGAFKLRLKSGKIIHYRPPLVAYRFKHMAETSPGDSGAPVILEGENGEQKSLIGHHVFHAKSQPSNEKNMGYAVPAFSVASALKTELGADVELMTIQLGH